MREPHNALVYGPTTTPVAEARKALSTVDSVDETNVLLVSYGYDHDRLRRMWHERIAGRPANFGTIRIAGGAGVDVDGRIKPVSRSGRDIAVTIGSSDCLVELGITISLYLDNWTEGRTVICFPSLEALLTDADTETAFRFLHVLTRRIASAGGVGRFSLDPDALDERTARTLEPMFDSVSSIEPGESVRDLSPDIAFDVLRAPRRRYVLHFLREHESATVSTIAAWVARHEPENDPNRVETSLHHSHLPKMENVGLIGVDGTRVVKRPLFASLVPYLDLVAESDLNE